MSNSLSCSFHRLTAFLLVFIFSLNFSVFAQTRKTTGGQTASNNSKPAAKCSGAWTGNVTYTRTQTMTDSKTVKRVSNRGEDKRDWEMRYNYNASVAVLESPERNGSNTGKARIEHNFSSIEKTIAREENSCDRGKTFRVMFGNFQTKTETTANATGAKRTFRSASTPTAHTRSASACRKSRAKRPARRPPHSAVNACRKKAKIFRCPPTETTVDGNSLTSDGTHRVNPSDPNRLSGSYSKTWQNVTETISWSLEKCGAPLRITDLQFEDMKYPNWNDWQEISEQERHD
jgi:hypothetical protein